MTEAQADILDTLVGFLKQLELPPWPLRPKAQGSKGGEAHQKVISALTEKASSFLEKPHTRGGAHGIDIVLRQRGRWDSILLTAEVDRRNITYGSWDKLLNIRAENKMWIYIAYTKKAKERFRESTAKFREYSVWRNEDSSSLGKFVLVLKSPEAFEVIDASQLLQVKQ